MDVTNVAIIMGRGWNKQKIVDEIELEGWKHNFFFCQNQEWDFVKAKLDFADECWVFGDASGYDTYNYVKKERFDIIWQMA